MTNFGLKKSNKMSRYETIVPAKKTGLASLPA